MSLKYALDESQTSPENNPIVVEDNKNFLSENKTNPDFDENNQSTETDISQDDLRNEYRRQYPFLFDETGNVKVESQDKAIELGIINKPVVSVPTGDETPSPYKYLNFVEQENEVKNDIKNNKTLSNVEKVALKPSVSEQMSGMLSDVKGEDDFRFTENVTTMTNAEAWTTLFKSMRGEEDAFNQEFYKSSKKEQGEVRTNFYMGTILNTLDSIGIGDEFLAGVLHLDRGLKYTGAYIQDKYEGLHKGLDEATDGEFSKFMKFDAKSGGRKFVGDIIQAIEIAEVLPAVSGLSAGRKTVNALKKGLVVLPSERINKKLGGAFAEPDFVAMTKQGVLEKADRSKASPFRIFGSKEKLVTSEKKVREDFSLISEQLGKQLAIEKGSTFGVAAIKEAIEKAKTVKSDAADVVISKVDETTGNKTLDFEKARLAGEETIQKVSVGETTGIAGRIKGVDIGFGKRANTDDGAEIATGTDTLLSPILNPEKFNPLIAVVADLKAANPSLFGKSKGNTVIDDLFELTVKKDLIADKELLDLLNKYGLNIEEYVLLVVGSGSKAGKVLNKLSQMKRLRPKNELKEIEDKAIAEIDTTIADYARRVENIRRGGLVSQIATAARNVWSMGIRMPLEALANVADTAIYSVQKGIETGSIKPIFSTSYKHSFSALKYVYTGIKTTRVTTSPTGRDTGAGFSGIIRDKFLPMGRELNMKSELEEFVDIILKDPKFAEQNKIMFGTVQEIQQSMGKGTPKNNIALKALDGIVDGYEDLIHMMNTPNRAIDVTYAKKPETPMFKEINRFLTRLRIGPIMIGTVLAPFPRFMFNNMELMGQYAGGASYPMSRKMVQLTTKVLTLGRKGKGTSARVKDTKGKEVDSSSLFRPLTEKDRERISRNMIGWAAMYSTYQILKEEKGPADYKKIDLTDGTVVDTTPFTPMRPLLYFSTGVMKFEEGVNNSRATDLSGKIDDGFKNVMEWTDAKEFIETVAGVNAQKGIGSGVLQTLMEFTGANDLVSGESSYKAFGRFWGELYSTFFVPFKQVKDLERAVGIRTTDIKEYGKDPNLDLDSSLFEAFIVPTKRMGFFISPEDEMDLPNKVFPFRPKGVDTRKLPGLKFLGFTVTTANTEDGEFIERLGFSDYKISSKSKVPSIKAIENEIFQEHLGVIVKSLREYESQLINDGFNKVEIRTKLRSRARVHMSEYSKRFGSKKSLLKRLKTDKEKTIYLMLARKFRRLPKDLRKNAMINWNKKNEGTEFIGSNTKHLEDVLVEAFIENKKDKLSTGLMKKQEIDQKELQQYLYGPLLQLNN